jgi:hypothetical protein
MKEMLTSKVEREKIQTNIAAHSPKPLVGNALLKKVAELGNLKEEDKARLCGYYHVSANNNVRADVTSFMVNWIEAKGLLTELRGRPNNAIQVTKNYVIVIPSEYIKAMQNKPGDLYTIDLDTNEQIIKLISIKD